MSLKAEITANIVNKVHIAMGEYSKLQFKIVDELPETGEENIVYLVPSKDPSQGDLFEEYIWINGAWEKIGSIDLRDYYTKEQIDAMLDKKVDVASRTTYPGTIVYARDGNGNPSYPNLRSTLDYGGYNIVYRDGDGRSEIADPVKGKDIANKDYVDESLSTKKEAIIEITWSELKTLRDSGKLIGGQTYRIIDYHCTTTQIDTQSADNQFDILVMADDEKTLNENARAAKHVFKDEQKEKADISDIVFIANQYTDEAGLRTDNSHAVSDYTFKSFTNGELHYSREEYEELNDYAVYLDTFVFGGAVCGRWRKYEEKEDKTGYIDDEYILLNVMSIDNTLYYAATQSDYFSNSDLASWEIKYCIDNDTTRFGWADTTNGKGVIYYMKDEFNNECPYDFKNIMFKRIRASSTEIDLFTPYCAFSASQEQSNGIEIVSEDDFIWAYTFSKSGLIADASLVGMSKFSTDYDSHLWGCYNNVVKPLTESISIDENNFYRVYSLNNIVFFTDVAKNQSDNSVICFCNSFGGDCKNFTSGQVFINNTFGNRCISNVFGDICHGIIAGNDFYQNNLNTSSSENIFADGCGNNIIKSGSGNYFGNACTGNIINGGNNSFGSSCHNNVLEAGSVGNVFGSYCTNNNLGKNSHYNIFAEGCNNNTLSNNSNEYNIFGVACRNNNLWGSCKYNKLGDNCIGNTIQLSCTYNILGSYCNYNTISTQSSYNTFGNVCTYNSLGGGCNYNAFQNKIHICELESNSCGNLIDSNVWFVHLTSDTAGSTTNLIQNVHIHSGVWGTDASTLRIITVERNLNYSVDIYAPNSKTIILD